jgi:hypothetical protein
MSFHVEMTTTNAAFEENPGGEIARILRDIADHVEEWPSGLQDLYSYEARDVKGNRVAKATYVFER